MDFDAISTAYCIAKEKVFEAQVELDELESKASSLRKEKEEAQAELERLLDLEQNDHVKRILEGDKAAPKKPKRLTRIANLREQIAGIKLAMPIHDNRVTVAREKLAEAQQHAGEEIIPALLQQKSTLLDKCAEPLEALLASLVEVAAMDDVQRHFSKADGSIVLTEALQRNNLFSAQALLKKFRQTLPDRFKDLAKQSLLNIDEAVEAKSQTIIHQIGG